MGFDQHPYITDAGARIILPLGQEISGVKCVAGNASVAGPAKTRWINDWFLDQRCNCNR